MVSTRSFIPVSSLVSRDPVNEVVLYPVSRGFLFSQTDVSHEAAKMLVAAATMFVLAAASLVVASIMFEKKENLCNQDTTPQSMAYFHYGVV